MRVREERFAATAKSLTIGRTITRKVMQERVALLSQDVSAMHSLRASTRSLAQGVLSTMCAPLVGESDVHGALYATASTRMTAFTRDDLELLCAITRRRRWPSKTCASHERLARKKWRALTTVASCPSTSCGRCSNILSRSTRRRQPRTITVLLRRRARFPRFAEHAPP